MAPAFRGEVEELATDHAPQPGGPGEPQDELGPDGAVRIGPRIRQDLEGEGLEGIARQDGRCFVEGPVDGRPATAEIIVVHGRQVVVDQGIAVQQLDGAPGPQASPGPGSQEAGRLERQEGPQPLAAAQDRVPHGGGEPGRPYDLA
jgi:hypothetical protein